MAAKEMVEVFNVNSPGKSSFVQKDKYDEVRRVLKEFMPKSSPGLTQDEMASIVREKVSSVIFEDRVKAGWWMKTVQLDLEARGLILRERTKPLRWLYDELGKEKQLVATEKRESSKREAHEMPDLIRHALAESGLAEAYGERPFYQRNDYIGWIMDAKREETRTKRLQQMLEELRNGDRYMNMAYSGQKS